MIPNWLYRLAFPEKEKVEAEKMVVAVVEEPKPEPVKEPELVVGEPVLSLIESIRNMEGWVFVRSAHGLGFGHEEHNLVVSFSRKYRMHIGRPMYHCLAEWMTDDEREHFENVVEDVAFSYIDKERKERHEREAQERLIERERFMVLVTK